MRVLDPDLAVEAREDGCICYMTRRERNRIFNYIVILFVYIWSMDIHPQKKLQLELLTYFEKNNDEVTYAADCRVVT